MFDLRSKDGYAIQPSSHHDIVEDVGAETYKLTIRKIGVDDGGVYTVTAKNEVGETTQQAKLTVHSEYFYIISKMLCIIKTTRFCKLELYIKW